MMSIDKILEELYMIDPELKKQEKELRVFIELMIKRKPKIVIDQKFVEKLKQQLLESQGVQPKRFALPNILMFSIPVGVAAIALLAIVSLQYLPATKKTTISEVGRIELVRNTPSGSFGELKLLSSLETAEGAASISARPYGGGGGLGSGPGGMVDSKMLIYPSENQNKVTYQYVGEELAAIANDSPVLKRIKGTPIQVPSAIASASGLEMIRSSTLNNALINSIQFKTTGSNAFFVSVDFNEGMISFNEDWNSWSHPESACRTQECFEQYRVRSTDIPANDVIIAAGRSFLSTYGISMDTLGEPVVNEDWKRQMQEMGNPADYYYPDSLVVTFPYQYNGANLIDESGNPFGIQLNYNVRLKAITAAYNIQTQSYEASQYTLETNIERIKTVAEKGGLYPQYWIFSNEKQDVSARLQTPRMAYVKMWFLSGENMSAELLVPAYVFPVITEQASGAYIKKEVIVPAVKEVLDQVEASYAIPTEVMPMVK